MLKRYSRCALQFFLSSCFLCAAETNHKAVVEAFFAPEGITNKSEMYTGEMVQFVAERTMGQYLGPSAQKSYRLLSLSDSIAVYAVEVKAKGRTEDWYAFVRKSNGAWCLEAVRTLAQTGLIEMQVVALRQKTNRSPDEDWTLRNAELILQSDAELKAYLQANISKFEALAHLLRSSTGNSAKGAKQLYLASVKAKESGIIEFIVGGILDNTVGYLYVPADASPPPLQPHEVIYIERIADHWYIFKTT